MSRSPRQTAAFSLFTFLDVMLCTLGALIIVLICVVRTAQIKNAEDTPQTAAEVEEIASQRDTVQWRAKHLETSREETRAQLRDRRLELSHIEEHSRRLRLQLAEMEAAKKALAGNSQKKEQLEQLRAEVERVSQLAAAAERDLDDARREAESKRPSYAVVPYEGPSQTMRRPLYIECTGEHIILQPENIELSSLDFSGPLGPGNPLAAGLRAAREYLDSYQGDNLADSGEPYPLLLVRPDGVEAYYVAREAMTSWGSEFGYELIDQDWKLEFREPAPAMVEAMRLAVEEARMRQQALARSAPRYFSEKKGAQWYRAAPSGGVVQESGPSDEAADRPRNGWGGRRSGGGGGGRYGGGYANQGSGGPSNWNGQGNKRGAGSGRYPSNYGNGNGTGTGEDSTGANSEAELTSIYGAAANTAPGSGSGSGSGNSPTGTAQGTGYGNPAGGVNPGGNGAGNNMFASGQGTGGGTGIAGTSVDNGTGDGSGNGNGTGGGLGLSAGGGDSLLASGTGNSQSPAATLPGAAGPGNGAATNPAGTPGAGGARVHRSPASTVSRTAQAHRPRSVLPVARRWEPLARRHFPARLPRAQPVRQRATWSATEQRGAMASFPTCPVLRTEAPADNRVDSRAVNQARNRDLPVRARTIKPRGVRVNRGPAVWACNPTVRRLEGRVARPAAPPADSQAVLVVRLG